MHVRHHAILAALATLLAVAPHPLPAADATNTPAPLPDLHQMRRDLDTLMAAPPAATSPPPVTITFNDGVLLKSGAASLRVGAYAQFDGRILESGHPGDDSFQIRRARIDLRGNLDEHFSYRLMPDFAGSPKLIEAWLDDQLSPALHLRAGQLKEPFSLEELTAPPWIDFVERSMVHGAFAPAEDLGVMTFGTCADSRLEYSLGLFNGRGKNAEDNNDDKDLAARLVLAPWATTDHALLRGLFLGAGGTVGEQERESLGTTPYRTQARTPVFTYASDASQDGSRWRAGADLSWLLGPACLRAEWIGTELDHIASSNTITDAAFDGWYVSGTWLVTGETKPRNGPVIPRNALHAGGWGAWELGARYEQFSADRDLLARGAATGTRDAQATTLGVNGYLTARVKVMLDIGAVTFSDDLTVEGRTLDRETVGLFRVQYTL